MTDDSRTWLKPDQVQSLRDACYSDRIQTYLQARNDAIIALLYDAGLRPTELVGLTVEMFDADEGVIRLPSSVQKQYPTQGEPRPTTIELAQDEYTSDTVRTVKQYLNNRWKDSQFLFPSRQSDAINNNSGTLRKMITEVAIEADVSPHVGFTGTGEPKDISPYTLRHSVAYRLLAARDDGTTMYDVRNRLRHTSLKTTEKHYDFFDSV